MSVWDLFKRKKKKPEKVDPAANLNQETEAKPAAEKAELETQEKAEREAREKAAAEKSTGKKKKEGFFSKLMGGLKKTRDTLFGGLFVENGEKIDDEFYEELEEAGDDRLIFRAQGRAQLARDILGALTRESA